MRVAAYGIPHDAAPTARDEKAHSPEYRGATLVSKRRRTQESEGEQYSPHTCRKPRDIIRIYSVRYEWDERKNRQNQRKHGGISFELAALVFEDENRIIGLDRVDETGEQRWRAMGGVAIEAGVAAVLLVVHVYREDEDGEEIIRIISARRADKNELRRYQKQAMD